MRRCRSPALEDIYIPSVAKIRDAVLARHAGAREVTRPPADHHAQMGPRHGGGHPRQGARRGRVRGREGAGDRGDRDRRRSPTSSKARSRESCAARSRGGRRAAGRRPARGSRAGSRPGAETSTASSRASWSKRGGRRRRRAAVETKLERDGRTLVYKAAGLQSDATPVVLIHGFGGDSDNWLFNIDELAKTARSTRSTCPAMASQSKGLASGDLGELAKPSPTSSTKSAPRRRISSGIRSARRSLFRRSRIIRKGSPLSPASRPPASTTR